MRKIFLIAILILLIDITSKVIVANNILDSITIIPNFFSLNYVNNYGAAFNILENNKFILILVAILIIVGMLIYIIKNKPNNNILKISYGFVLGGALGNLLDRIIHGYVIDFLDFKIFNYNFPIFNIADVSVVLGIIVLLIYTIKEEVK